MLAVISLLVIVGLSLLIIRVGSVALILTGVSKELAYFQAFSAFSGVGFTTHESEKVVNQPVRRRILMILMLAGSLGVVTAISSLILTFIQVQNRGEWLLRVLLLVLGLTVLYVVASSEWVNHALSKVIGWGLKKWTRLDIYDYEQLLQLSDGYAVQEVAVHDDDWLAEKSLADLDLSQEGILVLGIRRADDAYVGSPTGDSLVLPGDTLILYGRQSLLAELSTRQKGARGEGAHQEAMAVQRTVLKEQAKSDAAQK